MFQDQMTIHPPLEIQRPSLAPFRIPPACAVFHLVLHLPLVFHTRNNSTQDYRCIDCNNMAAGTET